MKGYSLLWITLLLLFSACSQKKEVIKPKPPIKESNQTVEINNSIALPTTPIENNIIVQEPLIELEEERSQRMDNPYDLNVNSELIAKGTATKIVVLKSKRVMVLFDKENNVLSRHRISLGKNSIGTKLKHGDYKTPEGVYSVIDKRPDKVYYREILLDYPHPEDRARSKRLGFSPGGGITIHAQPKWNWDGHGDDYTLSHDWTEGCMAITNESMNTIWDMVALGTQIEIRE